MLRDDFQDILRDYGHEVLVVKQNRRLRCSCWNEINQEISRTCPVCFGLGFVPIVEKHTVRERTMAMPETLARAIVPEPFGEMVVNGKTFYLRHDAGLNLQDLIVEVDWSPTGKPIYTGQDILEVNYIDPKRFENGQVTYLKISTRDQPVHKEIRGVRIVQSGGIKNYEFIGGKFDGYQ